MKLVKPIEFESFKKLVIMRLVTPINMETLDDKDRIKKVKQVLVLIELDLDIGIKMGEKDKNLAFELFILRL